LRTARRFWPFRAAVFAITLIPDLQGHYRWKGLPKTLSIRKIHRWNDVCSNFRGGRNIPAFSADLSPFPKTGLAPQLPIIYGSFRFGA
jgi:hypothetical protein